MSSWRAIINPLTISNLACFSFFHHQQAQLLFKQRKGCCWIYKRLFFVYCVFGSPFRQMIFRWCFFWAAGQCRQLVTWQLECLSVLECAGHCTLLTLHLSHPKHDWFDCSISWRGPLSAPQGYIWSKVDHLQCAGRMQTTSSFFLMLCILRWISYCP